MLPMPFTQIADCIDLVNKLRRVYVEGSNHYGIRLLQEHFFKKAIGIHNADLDCLWGFFGAKGTNVFLTLLKYNNAM